MTILNKNMKKNIHTLSQLYQEKEKLKLKMEITKHAFLQSLDHTQQETKHFLWSKVALPAILIGVTTQGIKALASSDNKKAKAGDSSWLQRLIPIALSLATTIFQNNGQALEENA